MATNSIITKVTGTDSSSNRIASTFYGTCGTAAATAQKEVTLSDSCVFNNGCLVTGVTIHVKFTNSNTNATPTLKVGTATAKQIMKYGTTKAGTTTYTSWYAGAVVSFTYDGTYWQMNDYVEGIDISTKMDKSNPTGTGSLSLNRKTGTTVGTNSVAVGAETTASGNYSFAEGGGTTASGIQAHAEGGATTASGYNSHSEGGDTTASSSCAHAEGGGTQAISDCSHAEGNNSHAEGLASHAEGLGTIASGAQAHAEGASTTASNSQSHAEGGGTTASGAQAHAEGSSTTASGNVSHAEGFGTIAASHYQHTGGKYNIADNNNTYAEIIGNGTYNARSNARTLDWQGNETIAGDLIFNGSTSLSDTLDDKTTYIECTQAQYDALPSSKLTDGVDYYITDAQAGAPLATEIAMSTSDNTSVAAAIGGLTILSSDWTINYLSTSSYCSLLGAAYCLINNKLKLAYIHGVFAINTNMVQNNPLVTDIGCTPRENMYNLGCFTNNSTKAVNITTSRQLTVNMKVNNGDRIETNFLFPIV